MGYSQSRMLNIGETSPEKEHNNLGVDCLVTNPCDKRAGGSTLVPFQGSRWKRR